MSAKDGKPCPKGHNEWYKNGRCKQCARERARRYGRANPEKKREVARQWYRSNPDRGKERARRQYWANPEKHNEYSRRYQQAHPEKHRQADRRYYQANREKTRERVRLHRQENPGMAAAARNRRRTRKTAAGGSYTPAEWKALCEQYDYRCLRCGKQEPEIKLTADHVLPVAMGGSSDISNIQLLCLPCNSWKGNRSIDFRTKPAPMRWIQKKLFG